MRVLLYSLYMDFKALAPQLRNPSGDEGRDVGKAMAQWNIGTNALAFECLGVQPSDHVLEIGFGPGEALAEAIYLTPKGFVAGLDQSETMLAMAQQRNSRAIIQDKLELTLGTADAMPYADGSFHKVFAANVGHFWKEPRVELAEIKRVLRPGGRLALIGGHPKDWKPGLKESGVFYPRLPEEWEKLLSDAGFKNVRTTIKKFDDEDAMCVTGES